MQDPKIIDVDDLAEQLSDERKIIAFKRALRRYGVGFETMPDGSVEITDEGVDDIQDYLDHDEFFDIFEDELKRLIANDMLEELRNTGYLRTNGIDENGEIIYTKTDKANEL